MNIEIANRLQKIRKEKGYSQEELADKLGISRQAVSKWERAESSPDTDNLICLAKLYGMSLDELLSDDESVEEIRQRTVDKESIVVDKDSVSITDDEGQTIKIKKGHITYINKDGSIEKNEKSFYEGIFDGVVVFLTVIAFVLTGFFLDAWYINWTLFILMPAVMSLFHCIKKKRVQSFAYPLLVTAVYCFLGMQYGLWHPYWFLFITIPLFYLVAKLIDKATGHYEDEDDEDDEEEDEE